MTVPDQKEKTMPPAKYLRELWSFLPWQIKNLRFAFGAPVAYKLGHFYSPICNQADLRRYYRAPDLTPPPDDIPGVPIDRERHLKLWQRWSQTFADCTLLTESLSRRYSPNNRAFGLGEAVILSSLIRELRPKRFVEIGCGYSSASALDTIEAHLDNRVACTFIDPFPQLLHSLLAPGDGERITIISKPVQEVAVSVFDALEENDILFVDTSHVLKTASDVAFELFEILPRVRSGVYIHFHDIPYPFEYPSEWVERLNYSWNEAYALRAFLQYNSAFEIVFFNDYFRRLCATEADKAAWPQILNSIGSGLWLRRR